MWKTFGSSKEELLAPARQFLQFIMKDDLCFFLDQQKTNFVCRLTMDRFFACCFFFSVVVVSLIDPMKKIACAKNAKV